MNATNNSTLIINENPRISSKIYSIISLIVFLFHILYVLHLIYNNHIIIATTTIITFITIIYTSDIFIILIEKSNFTINTI